MRRLLPIMMLCVASIVSVAQDSVRSARLGLLVDGRLNLHDASFRQLPGIPCCSPGFTATTAMGFGAGLVFTMPIGQMLTLQARGAFSTQDVTMQTDEARTVFLYGQAVPGLFRHTLATSIQGIGVDALLGYHPADNITLALGPSFFIPLSPTYAQTETIVSPAAGGFDITGSERMRAIGSGALPGVAAVSPAVTAMVQYDIPLDKQRRVVLSPEITATMGLTDLVVMDQAASSWRMHALRAGVTLTYALQSAAGNDPYELEYEDGDSLRGSILATALRPDGGEYPLSSIRIEQAVVTRSKPLLPYLFFDEKRAQLPQRYVQRSLKTSPEFDERQFHDATAMQTYYDILNIIGRRMQQRPRAVLTVTGLAHDQGSERGRKDIAAGRAYAVKDYLVTAWNINAARIRAGFTDVELDAARLDDDRYMDEQRRVELTSDDAELLADVWTSDTSWISQPSAVRFTPTVSTREDIASWSVVLRQDSIDVAQWSDEDAMPPIIDWDVTSDRSIGKLRTGELSYLLSVIDDDDASLQATGSVIPITVLSIDDKRAKGLRGTRTDRHTFIGFDVADAEPTQAHKRLADRIKQASTGAVSIRIDGYTDSMGDAQYNITLSKRRADAVGTLLGGSISNSTGHGAAVQRYDESLPEARLYARSVEVEIDVQE